MSTEANNSATIEAAKLLTWEKGRKSITRVWLGPDGKKIREKQTRTATHEVEGIRIRELPAASGSIYFRVETPAALGGKKQFKTLEQAKGYAAQVAAMQRKHGVAAFGLTDAQRVEAVKCYKLLEPLNASLETAVRFYIDHAAPKGGDRTVDQALNEFMSFKRSGRAKALRERTIEDLDVRLTRFALAHGSKPVKSIFPAAIEAHLAVEGWSNQTALNEWRVLHGFFAWCLKKHYTASNPVAAVDKPTVEDRAPGILTVKQAASLLASALALPELEYGPAIALGLFCGVRSEELVRLEWPMLNMGRGLLTIGPEIAKKRRIRNIELPACCKKWLLAFGVKESGKVLPVPHRKRWLKIVNAAGITQWPHNAMRHSFGSYHYALHQNAPQTCAILGQAEDDTLFEHYRALADKREAARFFKINPPAKENVVSIPKAA